MFLTIKQCTRAKINCLKWNQFFVWKCIWHWITYKGWYTIKPEQPTNQDNSSIWPRDGSLQIGPGSDGNELYTFNSLV